VFLDLKIFFHRRGAEDTEKERRNTSWFFSASSASLR
jgi:hypothetical protein